MSNEPSRPRAINIRPKAIADIEHQAEYLEENAPPDIATRFRIAIMEAIDQIALMPKAGSPREVSNALLSGLRMTLVPGFRNYLLFYLTPDGSVEIVRFLHGAQDVDVILEDEG